VSQSTLYASPQEAEDAFYRAFESRDVNAMSGVWAEDEEVACIHPLGPRLEGLGPVLDSWRRIFRNGSAMRVRVTQVQSAHEGILAVHLVHENITVRDAEGEREAVVLATNVYRLTRYGWRIVLHHASPAPSLSSAPEREAPPGVLH
jgi:ketosteroid isomerase-like protein